MGLVLQQPDTEIVGPARAAAVLRRLGLRWAAEPGFVQTPAPPVVPLSTRHTRDWWVGSETVVSYHGEEDEFPVPGRWTCDCTPQGDARCPHVAAAILVHAWNRDDLRPLFEQPAWALDVQPLLLRAADPVGADEVEAAEAAEPPRSGWVRYHLAPPRRDDAGSPFTRSLMRQARRDGRALKPRAMPDELATAERLVDGITDLDRRLHALHETLSKLSAGDRHEPLRTMLRAQAFELLLQAPDVWFGEAPLVPDPAPLTPRLRAVDGPEGIHLAWRTHVEAFFPDGPGYLVTGDGQLRPLADGPLSRAPGLLTGRLPVVPRTDAPRFFEQFVLHSAVPVELCSQHLPQSDSADQVEGRVRLAELEGALKVDLAFGYRRGEATVEVAPGDARPHLPVGAGLVLRDPERERTLAVQLARVVGRPAPALLEGDAALDCLLEGLPRLGPGWAIYGADSLRTLKVNGHLDARVRVPSGVDWFDLQLDFEVDGRRVDAQAVLRSWLDGRRYHRLDDGTVARLPTDWLARHGQASAELVELRRAGGGQLHAYAAPLVAGLLDEAEGDTLRWRTLVERLGDVRAVPEREIPPGFQGSLRGYQLAGYRWLCFLRDVGLAGCLADDMGLGKTIQALAALLDTHRPGGSPEPGPPSLIVAPTSVVYNWAEEARRFAPDLKVVIHHGPERHADEFDEADLVVTSYALLRIDAEHLDRPWRYVVLDEAQQIKNPQAQVARTARQLRAKHRLAMTGTPLENHLLELWSIFEFLMPGFFGARAAFTRRYATPIERDRDADALAGLRRRLRPFVLRRLKTEVATELPPRQEQVLYCELGPAQRALYERVKATYRETVMKRVAEVGVQRATLSVLEALMRLRQACCDPGLLPFEEAKEVDEAAKIELLLETLEETVETGHRSLVFSQWPSLLRRVRPLLDARGWSYLYLDGSTTQRHQLVDLWNDPGGPPVFLISLKAGGAGLNLTGADHVIHLDPWWNPAVEDQATDRAHRIGQTRPVVAYKLVAKDTVEEKILELQARKRALFDAAVEDSRLDVEQLTREDLEAVFAPGVAVTTAIQVEAAPLEKPAPRGAPPEVGGLETLLRPGVRVTNADVRRATGWGPEEARAWLREQVDDGVLQKRGRKRGTWYEVVDA